MQTALVTNSQFREINQSVGSFSLSQILAHANNDTCGSRGSGSCLTFAKQSRERGPVASEKIDESIAYMTRNLNRALQVSTLAALVNVSPSHYFALFKRHTGRAPMDYFTRLRMEEARRLLDSTESSVKEVAAMLGYDDPFYFSRVFKSVNQLAPSNYRMKRRYENVTDNSPCES